MRKHSLLLLGLLAFDLGVYGAETQLSGETFTAKILKVYSFQEGNGEYVAYVVSWKDHEVIIAPGIGSATARKYSVGDTVQCFMLPTRSFDGKVEKLHLAFFAGADGKRMEAVAEEVARRRALREAKNPPVPAPVRPPLLANGTVAPDFAALRPDDSTARLSDFQGKVVLLDFWSTWCGPCKAAMPHLEELHRKLQSQGLVVLGVCVWDDRAKFDAWQKDPEVKTSYLKVFDPAGKGSAESIAKRLYGVSGIPTFYLIDAKGKIAFSGVGAGAKIEAELEQALVAAGFKL